MKKLIFTLLFLLPTIVFGQTKEVTVDLNDLPDNVRQQVENQAAQEELDRKVRRYGQWVGLGKEVGTAVNGSLDALTTQAIDFSKTDLGYVTMGIVVFKVIGEQLFGYIMGAFFFVISISITIISYFKRTRQKILIKGSRLRGTAEYKSTGISQGDQAGYTIVHAVFLAIFTGVSCIIMFA